MLHIIVIISYLLFLLGVGIYKSSKVKTQIDFAIAGRSGKRFTYPRAALVVKGIALHEKGDEKGDIVAYQATIDGPSDAIVCRVQPVLALARQELHVGGRIVQKWKMVSGLHCGHRSG